MAGFLLLIITVIFVLLLQSCMRKLYKVFFVLIILSSTLIGSCKKQAKCGCDGDVINEFIETPVKIYYDAENNSAEFTFDNNPYARYYFCNPSEMMPELTKYDQGTKILIDCKIYYECNYMMQASNSYYSYYQAYMVEVTKIQSSLYGNDK